MKKYFAILFLLAVFAPSFSFADSYNGPFCYEDPKDNVGDDQGMDVSIRGTCKFIDVESVVSLDTSLQEQYILAQHNAFNNDQIFDDYWSTNSSEIIKPTSTNLTLLNTNIISKDKYGHSTYDDITVLLDKKYILEYVNKVSNPSEMKSFKNPLPIVVINTEEWKGSTHLLYSYSDILSFLKLKKDPFFSESSPILGSSSPAIYTSKYNDFGKYVASVKNPFLKNNPIEARYLDLDMSVTSPDIGLTTAGGFKQGHDFGYIVPATSPIKSIKNYWMFTKKNDKIVLAWQKTEYSLDDGTVKTVTNLDKNIPITSFFSNHSTSTVASSTRVVEPSEVKYATSTNDITPIIVQEKSFFSRIIANILSWFR